MLGTNLPDFNVLLPNPRTTYAISVTGSLNPTTILELTIGGSHNSIDINPANTKFNRGIYNKFTQASGYYIGKYRYNNVEFFAQDNWKVSSRLTLDYGIRFYWIQPQFDEALQTTNCRRSSGSRKGPGSNYGWTPSTRLNHTQFDTINSTLNVTSLTNPTPTNLASENGNRTGFRAVTTVRPPRNMQISARFQF